MSQYSILVNTCDSYEDCWHPFFKLFSIYWKEYDGKIYLNTEYKDYSYKGLNIIPIKGCEKNDFPKSKRAKWSQCLKWALENIDTEVVLYLQEDYFLNNFVKNDFVERYTNLMHSNTDIHCIYISSQAVAGDLAGEKKYDDLCPVHSKTLGRINCQAALWRRKFLMSCIRTYESAWQFEEFASKRELAKQHNIYIVDPKIVQLNGFEIIPYIYSTGISQGRWLNDVVPLFEKNNIEVDYSKRGFVADIPKRSIFIRIRYRITRIYYVLKHYFEIRKIKKTCESSI